VQTPDCCIPSATTAVDGCSLPATAAAERLDLPDGPVQHVLETLVELHGGEFAMGADDGLYPADGESPIRSVTLDAFRIASTAVTNAEYALFVEATGYKTLAERQGYSHVFHQQLADSDQHSPASHQTPWWRTVAGACWHNVSGKADYRSAVELSDYPVVHICFEDAVAYCLWARLRLPTEAQWEYAARGGLESRVYPWGDALISDGYHHCNIWQGEFPQHNRADDGYPDTCPVRSFEPNAFGLYNMVGNVWEWTADRFTRLHSPAPQRNPVGPLNGNNRVTRGGSFLCHSSYCHRYRNSSRQSTDPAASASNIGFRVADTIP